MLVWAVCILFLFLCVVLDSKIVNPDIVSSAEWVKQHWVLEVPRPAKKVCVFCYETRSQSNFQKLRALNTAYCKLHNYTFLYFDAPINYPPFWAKVKLGYDLLASEKYDILFWIDSDVVIHDTSICLESIYSTFGQQKDIFFMKSTDNHKWTSPFNAGVWLVKQCPRALEFFQDWFASYPSDRWHQMSQNNWKCLQCHEYANGLEYEQGAGTKLLQSPKYAPFVTTFHWTIFQPYEIQDTVPFTLHFCGDFKPYMAKYLENQSSGFQQTN